ncbi:MAG TPA: hypothetical protein VN723_02605 [Rhizomicrobium sp.]|jgi:hypothetical protein|nr:hypothetical protein [Rhizomicrobium sp.]
MEQEPTPEMPNKEMLNAFIDGELAPKDMERIAALLAERPDLDQWVRRQEEMRVGMKDAFSDLLSAAPPDRLVAAAKTAPLSWRWRIKRFTTERVLASAGAMLALGLVIGVALQPPSEIVTRGGQVMAQGALATALNDRLASDGYAGAGARIGISFRNRDGRDCRTFEAGAQSGLACHGDKGWAIALLIARPNAESSGAYRMAGSEMPDALRAAVTASIAGEPFDAAAEKEARDRGWK